MDRELILDLERIATAGLVPDVTLWLDLPLEASIARRGDRAEDRIEAEGQAFLSRVANGFRVLAAERTGR